MKKITPSETKKQALKELLRGRIGIKDEEGCLSEFIRLSVEKTLQELLEKEQEETLGRARYERRGETKVYRNGYEPGRLKTGEGVMEVQKPQIRGLDEPYRSDIWLRLSSTSEQLRQLIMEMYTLGMSTLDVEQALQRALGGFVLSKSSVSEITKELTVDYEAFKRRELSGFDVVYLFIDMIYEPLRRYGSKTGVMCCWAYLTDGGKVLLDMTIGNGESYELSIDFLRGMVQRGLRTPLTVTTDGAKGLIKAVEAMWPKSKRIRCWFHKMQNLQSKVPAVAWHEFKALIEDMRDAPTWEEGKLRMERIVEKYKNLFAEACRCLQEDAEASLNHLLVPVRHRRYVRTTNLVERSFVEERRRTKTIPHLWDEKSMVKLCFATMIRVSDRWSQRQFSQQEQNMIIQLRNQFLGENEKINEDTITRKRRSIYRAA
jgi:transposase-like protein